MCFYAQNTQESIQPVDLTEFIANKIYAIDMKYKCKWQVAS